MQQKQSCNKAVTEFDPLSFTPPDNNMTLIHVYNTITQPSLFVQQVISVKLKCENSRVSTQQS